MSGHSKWAQIKHQKGAADKKRATIFTKLANLVTVAAREAGGDPDMNMKLRLAIDRAKAANMPKDNIERAIKRGTGEGLDGAMVEELLYEGFGPDGVAIVVTALTSNRNRTASDLRRIFSDHGGNLGGSGSVLWMFQSRGVISIATEDFHGQSADQITLTAIDHDAQDIRQEDEGLLIFTLPEKLSAAREALEKTGITISDAGVQWVPTQFSVPTKSAQEQNAALITELEDHDDVLNVAHNLPH